MVLDRIVTLIIRIRPRVSSSLIQMSSTISIIMIRQDSILSRTIRTTRVIWMISNRIDLIKKMKATMKIAKVSLIIRNKRSSWSHCVMPTAIATLFPTPSRQAKTIRTKNCNHYRSLNSSLIRWK